MRVKMVPTLEASYRAEGGISTIVRAYHAHAESVGIEFVNDGPFDVEIVHAGVRPFTDPGGPNVSMNHGLYWDNQMQITAYEQRQNAAVIDNLRHARVITVPSEWVAQAIRRDMRINPSIIPHGIDWENWQHNEKAQGYILWNKNRPGDVCTPEPVMRLAFRRPDHRFVTTFAMSPALPNVEEIGVQPYETMKSLVQRCSVYMATAPETWGIGTVEAMAAGRPVLAFDWGNNPELVKHGVNGYLAKPGDWDDLAKGLDYCLEFAEILGNNGRRLAGAYTWDAAIRRVHAVLKIVIETKPRPSASVIIPCYNKQNTVSRAIHSALAQDASMLDEVIVVDDGSTDNSASIVKEIADADPRVRYVYKQNGGVASARNRGVAEARSDFVVPLDADDHINPAYLATTLPAILQDNSLGVVYTGLRWTNPDGRTGLPEWPGEYDFDAYLKRKPQVSTCALVRKSVWDRLGGQRNRYCERKGAGSEDAEFWFRAGAYGVGFKKVTDAPLFEYSSNLGITSQPGYVESDWQKMHSWQRTNRHPFASLATPERISHPVIARDRSNVSVIIPCSFEHLPYLVDALDSLDGQTYDRWEAIVVVDTANDVDISWYRRVFPHVTFVMGEGKGAGHARNLGVRHARADLLYFLDGDDWLMTNALEVVMREYVAQGGDVAVYPDYFSSAFVDPDKRGVWPGKEIFYDELTKKQVREGLQTEYDCEKAQAQPTNPPYFWAIASALIPRHWHYEIGGFDEDIPTWEDYLYFVQLARRGKCFVHTPEMVYVYEQSRGIRNHLGRTKHKELGLFDIIRQRRGEKVMPCNCGQRKGLPMSAAASRGSAQQQVAREGTAPSGPGTVEAMYMPGRLGKHRVIGPDRTHYGYHQQGDVFPVRKSHVKLMPHVFMCPECGRPFTTISEARGVIECNCTVQAVEEAMPKVEAPPPPPPVPVELGGQAGDAGKQLKLVEDWTVVPGIGAKVAERLMKGGVTADRLAGMTDDEMKDYGIFGMWPERVREWLSATEPL